MRTIRRAEIYLDDTRLCLVEKEVAATKDVPEPMALVRRSPQRMMYVDRVDSTGKLRFLCEFCIICILA